MSVHHLARDMANVTQNRMALVSAAAVTLCGLLFAAVASGSVWLVGAEGMPADVMQAFTVR
jgi:hypothetical protein